MTKRGIRVLVCGGRDYDDYVRIYDALDEIRDEHGITHVIAGGASGADRWAESWAWMNRGDIAFVCYPAGWKVHGKAAGPIRNAQMLRDGLPDLVLAFPGGRGTANMVKLAKAAGVEVIEVPANAPTREPVA